MLRGIYAEVEVEAIKQCLGLPQRVPLQQVEEAQEEMEEVEQQQRLQITLHSMEAVEEEVQIQATTLQRAQQEVRDIKVLFSLHI
jgi:hypothetical protein